MTRNRARPSIPRYTKPISLLLLTIVLGTPHIRCAGAEVRVEGELKAVQVEARDASVREVLTALGTSFGLQYRGAAPLDRRSAPIGGRCSTWFDVCSTGMISS